MQKNKDIQMMILARTFTAVSLIGWLLLVVTAHQALTNPVFFPMCAEGHGQFICVPGGN